MDKIGKILYPSHFDAFKKLTDAQVAQLIHKIGDDTYELTDPICVGMWLFLERDFIIQGENYQKKAEANRVNGRKGGRPAKPKETENNPQNPVGFSETQPNPKNLKDRDKDRDRDIEKGKDKVMSSVNENLNENLTHTRENTLTKSWTTETHKPKLPLYELLNDQEKLEADLALERLLNKK
jgi:hypothetical protein